MTVSKKLFLLSLILLISSCGLVPVKPDNDVLKQLDPELAKNLLKSKCPTCTDSKINLSCEDGYFVDDAKTKNSIDYPYHNLVMICYSEWIDIKGRETDCISNSNSNRRQLPKVQLKTKDWKELCDATFAVINNYREKQGIEAWGYYQQKAMPEND
jgi:hypothetical protein